MSKPRGFYLDPVLDWARRLSALRSWVAAVALMTLLAATGLWMVSFIPLMLLFWPNFDGNNGFGAIYLTAVAVWVVPCAVAAAVAPPKRR